MKIKEVANNKTPLNIREWNEEEKAYIKTMNGFERLAFNDFFITFYNKHIDAETRFDAGFRAALMVLVDEEGRPLLSESDRDAIRNGSFLPLFRLFDVVIAAEEKKDEGLETTKKN